MAVRLYATYCGGLAAGVGSVTLGKNFCFNTIAPTNPKLANPSCETLSIMLSIVLPKEYFPN